MSNRPIAKVKFEPEVMRRLISRIEISKEEIANKIDRDVRTLYRYIKNGEMPIDIYNIIMNLACDSISEPSEPKVEDKTERVNRMIRELTDLGFTMEQILGEVSKSLADVHPNMIDDEFKIILEVRFK